MAKAAITLSGGEFGGETVEIQTAASIIEKTDTGGNLWIYDYSLSKDSACAEFKLFIPADEVEKYRSGEVQS